MTRLLYIDDDAGLRRLTERGLEREGYEVETAADGDAGIARLAQGGFDVIALDHYMPGMDGLETLAKMRTMPEVPPVVFVTAAEESRIAVSAMKAGAADYVIKDVRGDFIPLLKVACDAAINGARLRKAKDDAEQAVRESRDRFEALAAEREILLREVNHRVGNSLQLIAAFLHMQAGGTEDAAVKEALLIAMGRVVAVGQVHRRLYTSNEVQSVCSEQYLRSLVEDLAKSSPTAVRIELDSDQVALDPDRAVAVGVIVNELVLNALKYAYPSGSNGPIRVSMKEGEREAELSVEDDGIGFDVNSAGGLGSRIVRAMATKLDSKVIQERKERGTRISIRFPLRDGELQAQK